MTEKCFDAYACAAPELGARIVELEKALRPFSNAAKKMGGARGHWNLCKGVKVADLRHAQKVLDND